jgi:hypothetical protein
MVVGALPFLHWEGIFQKRMSSRQKRYGRLREGLEFSFVLID